MVGQWTSQVRKMVGIHTGSRKMTLICVLLGLALCVLIGGGAPNAAAFRGNDSTPPQRIYNILAGAIWVSDDAGISWMKAGALPSRPLALAVAERAGSSGMPDLVFVGTESVGLLRSNDSGASWQPVDSSVLAPGNGAPLAVTALTIDPADERIVYAATNVWLGTSTARLTPLGVAVSVDGGQQWIQMSSAQLGDTPVQRLEPVTGRPLAVLAVNSAGSNVLALKLGPELSALLGSENLAVRASAARAIELIGDPATQPTTYRYTAHPDGTTEVQRSRDGGLTWLAADMLPKPVVQLAVNPADDTTGFARIGASLWRNGNSDVSWAGIDALPGRPLALAFADSSGPSELIFAGTDTQGLFRSLDGGTTWQAAGGPLSPLGAGSLAVTAITVNPGDQNVVYAAATFTMATPTGRHSTQSVFISVDDGRQWFEMTPMPRSDQTITRLSPISGASLAVLYRVPSGSLIANLEVNPALIAGLDDADAGIRAATARALGLYHDPSLLPVLMNHLHDPDPLAGDQVARAIGTIGDRSVSADLLKLLATAPAMERTRAALALGLLKSDAAVPGLAALLSTGGDPQAQRVAAEALAAIGTPSAVRTLVAPLANQQMVTVRHAAMGGLEMVGQPAVALLAEALYDPSAVVRANAAEMLGWLKPASAVAGLTRLLSDPDPAVQAQAAWALGETLAPALAPERSTGASAGVGTEPARLALLPAPLLAPKSASILAPIAALPAAPAPLAALPGTLVDVPADYWTLTAMVLLVLAMLASMLIWKGPRRPKTHFGPV